MKNSQGIIIFSSEEFMAEPLRYIPCKSNTTEQDPVRRRDTLQPPSKKPKLDCTAYETPFKTPAAFSDLPEEVVLMILCDLLKALEIIYREGGQHKNLHPNILCCSKKWLRLGRGILYGENVFGISSDSVDSWFGGTTDPIDHLWRTHLKRFHITITSYRQQGSQILDEAEGDDTHQFLAEQRHFIGRVCLGLFQVVTSPPDTNISVEIACQDPNYQILELFSYLPKADMLFCGVPVNYANYLRATTSGWKSSLPQCQNAYRKLQLLVWS